MITHACTDACTQHQLACVWAWGVPPDAAYTPLAESVSASNVCVCVGVCVCVWVWVWVWSNVDCCC